MSSVCLDHGVLVEGGVASTLNFISFSVVNSLGHYLRVDWLDYRRLFVYCLVKYQTIFHSDWSPFADLQAMLWEYIYFFFSVQKMRIKRKAPQLPNGLPSCSDYTEHGIYIEHSTYTEHGIVDLRSA